MGYCGWNEEGTVLGWLFGGEDLMGAIVMRGGCAMKDTLISSGEFSTP